MANLTVNTPDIEVTEQGIEIPEVQDVLTGVLQDFNDAFGGNLNIENVATPQGLLASDITYYMALKNAQLAYLSAMFDPSTSQGRWLDALAQIYFVERKKATPTVVTCLCTGVSGYTLKARGVGVPENQIAKAQDDNGYVYEITGDVTFPNNGQVIAVFQCQTAGAIDCPAGALTKIYQAVTGWDAITNPSAGVIGSDLESDRAFEQRRYDSVAQLSNGSINALRGAVASVDGVSDVFVTENTSGSAVTMGVTNYSLLPHSVYVAVIGGADSAVADAIWRRKNAGSNMNGNTTVQVTDTDSYSYPYPVYNIKFMRPASTPVYVEVNIDNNSNLPADVTQLIQEVIIDIFTGEAGNGRGRIGGTVYVAAYYTAISDISDSINVISIYIGKTASPTDTSVEFGIDQAPVLSASQITVNVI